MKQCQECWRFLPQIEEECVYCGSQDLEKFNIYKKNNENLEIVVKNLKINGEEFYIEDVIHRNDAVTVMKVKDSKNKLYVMKVSLLFNEYFTNNKGNELKKMYRAEERIVNEINILKKIRTVCKMEIKYLGKVYNRDENGVEREFSVILMEEAEMTLAEIIVYLKLGGYIPVEEKKKIIYDLLNELKYYHSKNIIHRDLAHENIFLIRRGRKINYLFGDFGSGKDEIEKVKTIEGSYESVSMINTHVEYIPPEVDIDNIIKHTGWDIYSLALIILEIIIGSRWWEFAGLEYGTRFNEEYFEKYYKNVLGEEIYKILLKALRNNYYKDRYGRVGKFLEDYKKKVYMNENEHLVKKSCKKRIKLLMKLKLPLHNLLIESVNIDYVNINMIKIEGIGDIFINFKNGEVLKKVNLVEKNGDLKNKGFFEIRIEGNSIELNINRKYMMERWDNLGFFLISQGKITVRYYIDIEYYPRR